MHREQPEQKRPSAAVAPTRTGEEAEAQRLTEGAGLVSQVLVQVLMLTLPCPELEAKQPGSRVPGPQDSVSRAVVLQGGRESETCLSPGIPPWADSFPFLVTSRQLIGTYSGSPGGKVCLLQKPAGSSVPAH